MNKRIVIISSCVEEWGGSEELWARSIRLLQQKGLEIVVVKDKINKAHPKFVELSKAGVTLVDIDTVLTKAKRLIKWMWQAFKHLVRYKKWLSINLCSSTSELKDKLLQLRPHLVIIAQGCNFDGLHFAFACVKSNLPYVIINQKAVDLWWPPQKDKKNMIEALLSAKKCFFVSRHNLLVSEEQFGVRLPNAAVIFNPVKVDVQPLPYPEINGVYRLACIGRLWVFDKGQDMLLRVLAQEKWKKRPISVSFFGKGVDEAGLKDLAHMLNITNVEFKGFDEDIKNIWLQHHALVLPSRHEGLPLVILEAMALGRPVITTMAGGNLEIIEDGITGFIGEANERSLDCTLERAWERRTEWPLIGVTASEHIRNKVPASPENKFLEQLSGLL